MGEYLLPDPEIASIAPVPAAPQTGHQDTSNILADDRKIQRKEVEFFRRPAFA
jgi:hypothetical protein